MPQNTVRSTLYLEPALHRAVRLKAATAHRSMSDIVNEAIRATLREDEQDLATFAARERERSINYEALLAQLKAELSPTVSARVSAEALVERWRHLPQVDPTAFRADIDSTVDCSL